MGRRVAILAALLLVLGAGLLAQAFGDSPVGAIVAGVAFFAVVVYRYEFW